MATWVVSVKHREPFDVYIGRDMRLRNDYQFTDQGWGNPFTSGSAIERYRNLVLNRPDLLSRLGELRGQRLGCWCAPKGGLPGNLHGHTCHGEVLAALADMAEADLAALVDEAQMKPIRELAGFTESMPDLAPSSSRKPLKVLSLWQPWATLMAAGYKRIETRSWSPRGLRPGQLVAIHAAKRWTEDEQDICTSDPFFKRYLMLAQRRGLWDFEHPPLGCVVAIARFQEAIPTDEIYGRRDYALNPQLGTQLGVRAWITELEMVFGNYAPERYGWLFSEVRPLRPIPLKGAQGLFTWTPPDELPYLEPRNPASATAFAIVTEAAR